MLYVLSKYINIIQIIQILKRIYCLFRLSLIILIYKYAFDMFGNSIIFK